MTNLQTPHVSRPSSLRAKTTQNLSTYMQEYTVAVGDDFILMNYMNDIMFYVTVMCYVKCCVYVERHQCVFFCARLLLEITEDKPVMLSTLRACHFVSFRGHNKPYCYHSSLVL